LQDARKNENPDARHQEKVEHTRTEIEAFRGWVYGSVQSTKRKQVGLDRLTTVASSVAAVPFDVMLHPVPAPGATVITVAEDSAELPTDDNGGRNRLRVVDIEWPIDNVYKDEWSEYGQLICDKCKELSLDFSTIYADLLYILYETTSEEDFFNGILDHGRGGIKLADVMELKEVVEADLSEAMVVALRFYTSHSFHAINKALRANNKPHPLPATVMCINEGIKNLRALDAESDKATAVIDLYRGFNDTQVTDEFKELVGVKLHLCRHQRIFWFLAAMPCGWVRKMEGCS
jgi:hypothetical protein